MTSPTKTDFGLRPHPFTALTTLSVIVREYSSTHGTPLRLRVMSQFARTYGITWFSRYYCIFFCFLLSLWFYSLSSQFLYVLDSFSEWNKFPLCIQWWSSDLATKNCDLRLQLQFATYDFNNSSKTSPHSIRLAFKRLIFVATLLCYFAHSFRFLNQAINRDFALYILFLSFVFLFGWFIIFQSYRHCDLCCVTQSWLLNSHNRGPQADPPKFDKWPSERAIEACWWCVWGRWRCKRM